MTIVDITALNVLLIMFFVIVIFFKIIKFIFGAIFGFEPPDNKLMIKRYEELLEIGTKNEMVRNIYIKELKRLKEIEANKEKVSE